MTPGAWPVWTSGARLEATEQCYMLNLLALCLMVSEKKIFEGFLAI